MKMEAMFTSESWYVVTTQKIISTPTMEAGYTSETLITVPATKSHIPENYNHLCFEDVSSMFTETSVNFNHVPNCTAS
jgi:hypothetical protein